MHQELLQLLAKIVSFPTTTAEAKGACLEWIEREFLSHAGLPVQRGDIEGAPYRIVRHPLPKLLWFAHIDVVPGRPDQFTVRVEGDTALGRGVKDMKGAALAFLIAYRDACRSGHVPPVSVLLTSDEETGGHSPPALLDQKLFTNVPVAFTPDTGANPHMVTELKGAVWAMLTADGTAGHGALSWECDNPVWRLTQALAALQAAFPPGGPDDWQMTVTPTQLHGSDALNRIPAMASCTLDIRFPPELCATPDEALAIVRTHLPERCRLETIVTADPMRIDPAHPMVQLVHRLAEETTGEPVGIGREHGSSDARSFAARGIPAFLFGPKGGDLHGEAEWVSVSSLAQHVTFNRRLLQELSEATF